METDFFDILAGVQQGDTLAPFLFVVCLDYVLRTSVDKISNFGLTLTKARRNTQLRNAFTVIFHLSLMSSKEGEHDLLDIAREAKMK